MARQQDRPERVFKAAWFSKAARKAHIPDAELCDAIRQVMLGQADDLGGGVYKKRLGKNLYRSIIIARGGPCWVYEYLYAKSDRANISSKELARFWILAMTYEQLSEKQVAELVEDHDWLEICHE